MAGEQIKVCGRCGEPVVFTFEFPGIEYHCVACGWGCGVLGVPQAPATDALMARYAELHDQYERERAERTGEPVRPREERQAPTCGGCGKVATGPLDGDKPAHWYSRTRDGETQYACSTDCIPADEMVMPW